MKLRRSKKDTEAPRQPHLNQKRPAAYRYTSQRSSSDRAQDRVAPKTGDERQKKSLPRSALESLLSAVSITLLLVSFGYVMSLSNKVDIKVEAQQANLIKVKDVEQKANTLLSESPSNRLKAGIDTDKIEQQIEAAFPEIADAQLSISLIRHRPQLTIVSASPAALVSTSNTTYVLSESGVALFSVQDAPDSAPLNELPTILDQSTFNIQPGKSVLARSQLESINQVRFQLANKNIQIDSISLRGGGGEFQIKPSGVSYYVRFNFFEDARIASGTYMAVKERLEREKVTPSEYVDVRVPERAYIK